MWFDRKFDFQTLNTTFPVIVERLAGTPLRLEQKLKSLPMEILTQKSGDSWSIQENAGHLLDLEPLWLGRVRDMEAGLPVLREADLTNQKTHQGDHNRKPIVEILTRFGSERSDLVSALSQLHSEAETLVSNHPRLGTPMRLIDLAYFVAEHDDHHLVTINNLNTGTA